MAVGSNGREEPVEVNRMLPKKPKTNILVDGGDPSFKTRMAIDAQSAPHTLFDY
jgi:hypothetical protein